jgi:hypothetical protein
VQRKCHDLLCRGILLYLNSFAASLIFGDAYDILLIKVIYLIIIGRMAILTQNPDKTMKLIQGI